MTSGEFICEVFDRMLRCPVLQSKFYVPDIGILRIILGSRINMDFDVKESYSLSSDELSMIRKEFNLLLDPDVFCIADSSEVRIYRYLYEEYKIPYLIHGGYELFLLIEGRKKLAKFSINYPPKSFDGEEQFDYWVSEGVLHKFETSEEFGLLEEEKYGLRTIYYTLKGEEWRIQAMIAIYHASGKCGEWNEYFERLEGMLFGYEDWQNDWWIAYKQRQGGVGGAALCCAVTAQGLSWLESAGFRALPPSDRSHILVSTYNENEPEIAERVLHGENDNIAVICFTIPLWLARETLPITPEFSGTWIISSESISKLNLLIRNKVVVVKKL